MTQGKSLPAAVIAAFLLLLHQSAHAQELVPDEEWVSLFNGEDLAGWIPKIRGYAAGENFGDTFRVQDGLLTVSYEHYDSFDSRFGHIFYEQAYSNYRIRIEYRFVGEQAADGPDWAERNSGVMLHSQSPYSMGIDQDFPISIEVQFLGGLGNGNRRPTGNLCTPGTNVVYQGQFTSQHCNHPLLSIQGLRARVDAMLVLGDQRIVHSVNGRAVLEYEQPTLGGGSVSGHDSALLVEGRILNEGYISLQSESHPVQFRRVEILNLEGCMDPESMRFRAWFVEPDPAACN